jgi:hypothetical protein
MEIMKMISGLVENISSAFETTTRQNQWLSKSKVSRIANYNCDREYFLKFVKLSMVAEALVSKGKGEELAVDLDSLLSEMGYEDEADMKEDLRLHLENAQLLNSLMKQEGSKKTVGSPNASLVMVVNDYGEICIDLWKKNP